MGKVENYFARKVDKTRRLSTVCPLKSFINREKFEKSASIALRLV